MLIREAVVEFCVGVIPEQFTLLVSQFAFPTGIKRYDLTKAIQLSSG